MAINPSLFNFNQTPPPGELPATKTTEYIIVPDGRGGVIYYRIDSPQAQEILRNPAMSGQFRREPIDESTHGNLNGYNDKTEGAAAVLGLNQGTLPAEPSPSPSPQPAAPSQPASAPRPSTSNVDKPPAVAGVAANGLTTDGSTPATGPWIRVSPYGSAQHGDQLGVDIVRYDSQAGRAYRQKVGEQTASGQILRTEFYVNNGSGYKLPDALTTTERFQAMTRVFGGDVIDFTQATNTENGQPVDGYTVKFRMPNGIVQEVKFSKSSRNRADGSSADYFEVTDMPAPNLDGYSGPDKQALQAAQQRLAEAQAAHQRASAAGQDLKNVNDALDNAEKEFNVLRGIGNVTNKDVLSMQQTAAGTALTQAQAAAVPANVQVAQQGAVNQTYQQVLQYFKDIYGDNSKALEMAMTFYNNHANVDANNNRLAVDAARAWVDAETAANTQRVSLANQRLGQANQSFSDDVKSSMDMNQYMEPGSDKGFKAFMAMQAIRDARARKQGAFDVNDKDLVFDPTKRLPNGIRAFANPSNPSFATYPDLQSMRDEGTSIATGLSAGERPKPPGFTPTPYQQPTAPPNVASRPATPARPAGTSSATPSTAQRAQGTGQNTGADGNERPDDIITYTQVDASGKTIMDPQTGRPRLFTTTRANWNGVDPETRANWTIQRADPAPTQPTEPGAGAATGQSAPSQQQNDPFPPGASVLPPAEPEPPAPPWGGEGAEKPDDVIIFDGPNGREVATRAEWDGMRQRGEVRDDMVVQARPSEDFEYTTDENGRTVIAPREGVVLPKIMMEDQPSPGQTPPTTTEVLGFDLFGNRRRPTPEPYASTREMPKQVGSPMPIASDGMQPWIFENGPKPKPQPDRNIEFFIDPYPQQPGISVERGTGFDPIEDNGRNRAVPGYPFFEGGPGTVPPQVPGRERDRRPSAPIDQGLWPNTGTTSPEPRPYDEGEMRKQYPSPFFQNGTQAPLEQLRESYGEVLRNSRDGQYPSYSPTIFRPQPPVGTYERQDSYQPYIDQLRETYGEALRNSRVRPPDPTEYRSPALEYTQYELADRIAEEERRRREREAGLPFGLSDLLNGAFSF